MITLVETELITVAKENRTRHSAECWHLVDIIQYPGLAQIHKKPVKNSLLRNLKAFLSQR